MIVEIRSRAFTGEGDKCTIRTRALLSFMGITYWYRIIGDRTTSEMFPVLTDFLQHAELQPATAR